MSRLRSPSIVAALSFLVPGLGQLTLGAVARALIVASPAIALAGLLAAALVQGTDPYDLAVEVLDPGVLPALLIANVVLAAYHLVAIADAWRLGVRSTATRRASRRSVAVLAGLMVVTVGAHGWVEYIGIDANATLDSIFPGGTTADTGDSGDGTGSGAGDGGNGAETAAGASAGATDDTGMIPEASFGDEGSATDPLPPDNGDESGEPDPGDSGGDVAPSDETGSPSPTVTGVPTASTSSAGPNASAAAPTATTAGPTGSTAPSASGSVLPTGSAASAKPSPKPTAVPAWARDGRLDILLVGSDAGPDRWSLRTDTMIVLSVDTRNGRAALIGIPRNMIGVPLAPEDAAAVPDGKFPGLLNALYVYAMGRPDKFPGGDNRGFRAVSGAVQELLGIRLDGMVVVDLAGFVDLVDELGGLWIDIPERLQDDNYPLEDGSGHISIDFRPGCQHLEGRMALAYARSRHQDSDYGRMRRQQEVLIALRRQLDPVKVASRAGALLKIARDNLWTSIRRSDLVGLARLAAKVNVRRIRTILFVPPRYAEHLDDAEIAKIRAVARGALRGPLPPLTQLPSGADCR